MNARPRAPVDTEMLVIGTGFSELGMGIALLKEGRRDFVIVEKADDVGETWRDNSYPGCACDIQSHMYSFSFEQNSCWSRTFSPRQEIWDYLRRVTDKYRLRRFIRFGVAVTGASWDTDAARWTVQARTSAGQPVEYRARFRWCTGSTSRRAGVQRPPGAAAGRRAARPALPGWRCGSPRRPGSPPRSSGGWPRVCGAPAAAQTGTWTPRG